MRNNNTTGTLYMVETGIDVAIIFIMAFTPLGYFQTLGLSITFLTVPVAVGAILLGPKGGAVCGLAFGITSLMQCFGIGFFGTMLFQHKSCGDGVYMYCAESSGRVAVRTDLPCRQKGDEERAYLAASLACPVLNTVLYMTSLVVFFYQTDYIQGFAQTFGTTNPSCSWWRLWVSRD